MPFLNPQRHLVINPVRANLKGREGERASINEREEGCTKMLIQAFFTLVTPENNLYVHKF